jgi:hypothetical protein
MTVVKPVLSIKLQCKYGNLNYLLVFQFLYRERALPPNATFLLPSLMLSTRTTNLGLKAIVVRNSTKLNETNIREESTKETS